MNRTDRLTGIVLALRGGRRTVQALADRFEVSRRTILRDVSSLSEIGVPLITVSGVGGGVEIADGYWLPPLHLSPAEATVLLLGLQGIGETAAAPLGLERRTAEEKLRAVLRPDVAGAVGRALASIAVTPPFRPGQPEHFATLRAAVSRNGWVVARYQSARRTADHTLYPMSMFLEEGRWYCEGIVLGEIGRRRFRLDRMMDVQPCPDPAGAKEMLAELMRPARPYDDQSYPEIVVRLTDTGMRRADDEPGWVGHIAMSADGEWELRYRCPPTEHAFYAREVFGLGAEAEAIAPPEFRGMVRDLIASAVLRYRGPVDTGESVVPNPSAG